VVNVTISLVQFVWTKFLLILKNDAINEGEQVVSIGKQGGEEITVYELANRIHSIPYEITTSILKRMPRIFVENNVKEKNVQD